MARARLAETILVALNGLVQPGAGATVTVRVPGTSSATSVPLFENNTGSTAQANPMFADAAGFIEFYVDAGQRFDLFVQPIGAPAVTMRDIAALPDPASLLSAAVFTNTHLITPTIDNPVITGGLQSGVALDDGALAAPSLPFVSSPTSGLHWDHANGRMVFGMSNTEAVSINASGALVNAHAAAFAPYTGSDHRLVVTDVDTQTAGHILAHFELQTSAGQDNGVSRFYGHMKGQDGGGPGQLRASEMQIIRYPAAGASTTHILEANYIDRVVSATDPRRCVVFQGSTTGKFSWPDAVSGQGIGLHLYGDIGFESFFRFYGPNLYTVLDPSTGAQAPVLPASDPTADLVSYMDAAGNLRTTGSFMLATNSRNVSGNYPFISITGTWADAWSINNAGGIYRLTSLPSNQVHVQCLPGATGTTWLRAPKGVLVSDSNVSGPSAAAALDVDSTRGALIVPRMSTTNRDAIASQIDGMHIMNTTTVSHELRQNSHWMTLGTRLLLNQVESTNVNNGDAMSGGTSHSVGTTGSFTVVNPNSIIIVSIAGFALILPDSTDIECYSQFVIDGSATYRWGGHYAIFNVSSRGTNVLSGGSPVAITNPGAGSHTIQVQAVAGAASHLYLRASGAGAQEHMRIQVWEVPA